jgi:hypothetical protein
MNAERRPKAAPQNLPKSYRHDSTSTDTPRGYQASGSSPPEQVYRDQLGRWRHTPERLAMAPPEADFRNAFGELAHAVPNRRAGAWRADAGWLVSRVRAARAAGAIR